MLFCAVSWNLLRRNCPYKKICFAEKPGRLLELFSHSETAFSNPVFLFFSIFFFLRPRCIMYYISYIIRDKNIYCNYVPLLFLPIQAIAAGRQNEISKQNFQRQPPRFPSLLQNFNLYQKPNWIFFLPVLSKVTNLFVCIYDGDVKKFQQVQN